MKNQRIVLIVAVLLFVAAIYVLTPGAMTGFLARTGQFTLGNDPVQIQAIYLNGAETTMTATDTVISGVSNSTKAVTVKVQVYDTNGNCNEFTANNGTAWLCDGDRTCDDTNRKHIIADLEYDAGDGQWGAGNEYCNLTGTAENWQFYEVNGTWSVGVSITDGSANGTLNERWYYNEIRAITYPASGSTIDLGSLTLGNWNDGKSGALMQNAGNIILNLSWNATDFTGQAFSDVLALDGTNFLIDDDGVRGGGDSGNIPQRNISGTPTTQITFNPEVGLKNCSSVVCDPSIDSGNATIEVMWHLQVPNGLHEDTYTDTIEVSTTDFV